MTKRAMKIVAIVGAGVFGLAASATVEYATLSIFIPIFAVAIAAFSVWLTVRIVNRRERWAKRLAFWMIAAYPISFLALLLAEGTNHLSAPAAVFVAKVYRPLLWIGERIEAALH